jgi:hypothetical protein
LLVAIAEPGFDNTANRERNRNRHEQHEQVLLKKAAKTFSDNHHWYPVRNNNCTSFGRPPVLFITMPKRTAAPNIVVSESRFSCILGLSDWNAKSTIGGVFRLCLVGGTASEVRGVADMAELPAGSTCRE